MSVFVISKNGKRLMLTVRFGRVIPPPKGSGFSQRKLL